MRSSIRQAFSTRAPGYARLKIPASTRSPPELASTCWPRVLGGAYTPLLCIVPGATLFARARLGVAIQSRKVTRVKRVLVQQYLRTGNACCRESVGPLLLAYVHRWHIVPLPNLRSHRVSHLLLAIKHLQPDGQRFPQRLGHAMNGLDDVELHTVVQGVRVHLAEAHDPLRKPHPPWHDQALWLRRHEAPLAGVKYPLLGHIVRRRTARFREKTRGQAGNDDRGGAS